MASNSSIQPIPLNSDYFLWDRERPDIRGTNRDNTYYTCYLACPDKGIMITANLPQEYSLDLGASYESSFSQSISDNAYSAARKTAGAMGLQFATKAMTAKVWQGSNDVTFTLPFIFQLETDPYTDILEPLSQLYELILPDQSTMFGLLQSPGPRIDLEKLKELSSGLGKAVDNVMKASDTPKSDAAALFDAPDPTAVLLNAITNNCMLLIGDYQYFDSVIVTNIAQTTHVLPYYKTGTMSRVEVAVTFSTFVVPTKSDIPNLLMGSDAYSGLTTSSTTKVLEPTQTGEGDAQTRLEAGLYNEDLTEEEQADYLDNSGYF